MIFVAGTRGFSTIDEFVNILSGQERTDVWEEGMTKTLADLKAATPDLVYLADTPISQFNVPQCLSKYPRSLVKCATPYSKAISESWINEEEKIALGSGATFVDPTSWICQSDPCSPVQGRNIIYVDGGHLTATFSKTLERPLWQFLTARHK